MGETTRRILSAIVLVAAFLFVFLFTQWYYLQMLAFAGLVYYFGILEFYAFCKKEESKPFVGTGVFFGALILVVFFLQFLGIQTQVALPDFLVPVTKTLNNPNVAPVSSLLVFLFITSFALQITRRPLDGAMFSVTSTLAGVVYLAIPLGTFFLLLGFPFGEYYVFLVSTITMISDAGAYFGGRWFGRNPAGLAISPKKTWEGYITGNITAILSACLLIYLWETFAKETPPMGYLETSILSFFISIVSVIGDLAESAMKRDARVKDSGNLIPGHGGVLDLGDAMLFTIPTLYTYLKVRELLGFQV